MCEVPAERKRKPPPPTPRMRALLAAMAQTDSPVIWDFSRGIRTSTYTLDGQSVPGAAVTGTEWRGLTKVERAGQRSLGYRLTDAGREAIAP